MMMMERADDGFDALLAKIERERGFACSSYKEKCLRRRVAVRLRARGVGSFEAYARLLDGDAQEFDRLVETLTINVTRFFRNWPVWEQIARRVVPELWESQLAEIPVWSAGCATGEEAYSMAILFHRQAAISGMLPQIGRVRVLGTDVDRGALAAAAEGEYGEEDLSEAPTELRGRYFADQRPYYPVDGIRRMVRFAQHDLLAGDYPPMPQQIIICRNVLIYFERPTQERVIQQLHESLAPGGFLILGKVETLLGTSRHRFVPIAQRERIFRKVS